MRHISLAKQAQLYTKLRDKALVDLSGVLDAEQLNYLTDKIHFVLNRASKEAIFDSLRIFIGSTISREDKNRIAFRLAANYIYLQNDISVSINSTLQTHTECVTARIAKIEPDLDYHYRLYLYVYNGQQAGKTISVREHKTVIYKTIPDVVGFSWRKYRFYHYHDLVNLKVCLGVVPGKAGEAVVNEYVKSDSLILDNRKKVLALRYRYKPCPNNYENPCYECAKGYETCPGGTHKHDYIFKRCVRCQADAVHDPEDSYCISCTNYLKIAIRVQREKNE